MRCCRDVVVVFFFGVEFEGGVGDEMDMRNVLCDYQ